jgi:hypothetical protein
MFFFLKIPFLLGLIVRRTQTHTGLLIQWTKKTDEMKRVGSSKRHTFEHFVCVVAVQACKREGGYRKESTSAAAKFKPSKRAREWQWRDRITNAGSAIQPVGRAAADGEWHGLGFPYRWWRRLGVAGPPEKMGWWWNRWRREHARKIQLGGWLSHASSWLAARWSKHTRYTALDNELSQALIFFYHALGFTLLVGALSSASHTQKKTVFNT